MKQKPLRVYADTSVFGGTFDIVFRDATRTFFEQVREGYFLLTVSTVVRRELLEAPARVRGLYQEMLPMIDLMVDISEEAVRLSEAYLKARIVTPKSADDAAHVALATVSNCSAIVSWNFRHIVHFQKIPLYNAVNALHGYRNIAICSPQEVIDYEDKDQEI